MNDDVGNGWPQGIGHMGYKVGTIFSSRKDLGVSGLHKQQMAGIFRAGSPFAHSIVLSDGYKDNEDYHEYILYTGDGGRDPKTRRQIKDQELIKGNLGLYNSRFSGFPVRVVRGYQTEKGPTSGYRYDGLYIVVDAFQEPSIDGPLVWRFKMIPLSDNDVILPDDKEQLPPSAPKRVETTVSRRIRNTAMIEQLKMIYDYSCQLCGLRINLPTGRGYCEGAHVQPLSHEGPDIKENILILCPNHHVMLDHGGLILNIDGSWSTQEDSGLIEFNRGHKLSEQYINFHHE